MRRIAVLGCGFAGFEAARQLQRALLGRRRVQLTVISDRSHFLYTPLLANAATGELDIAHITFPIRAEFHKSTEVLVERVEGVDVGRRVLFARSGEVDFDYLLIACGATVDWGGHPEWSADALTFKSARDAIKLREAVAGALEEAARMSDPEAIERRLTFVFGGGGPTGVEVASEVLSSLVQDVCPHLPERLRKALRVVVVEQQPGVLPDMPSELGRLAREHLRQLGMELRLGTRITGRTADQVELSTGEVIKADNFIWCGGVRAPDLVAQAGLDVDEGGCVRVDSTLQVHRHPGVFAVGDVAALSPGVPHNAQVATGQAEVAARNIVAELSGRARRDWEFSHRGDLVSLGRANAVGYVGDSVIQGRAAWALYRLIYTTLIPTGVKKAQLLKEWVVANFRPTTSSWSALVSDAEYLQLEDAGSNESTS